MLRRFLFISYDDYCKIGTRGTGPGVRLLPAIKLSTFKDDETGELF